MTSIDLSIIIPSHQRSDLLQTCLDSVCRFAPQRSEIIVVDDASPNRSAEAVARAAGVRYLRLRRRHGFCAAANEGIKIARGSIVELLNDDAEVTVTWSDAPLAAFRDSSVGAVAPLVLMAGRSDLGQRIDSAGDCYYWGGVACKRWHGKDPNDCVLGRRPVFGASACAAFYRRDVVLALGAFPSHFEAYFEDVDLAFRLHRAGYHVLFEPASIVFHHVSASYALRTRQLLQQQASNEERVFWRNMPGAALPQALPRHVAVLAAKAWRRWQEGTLAPFICGRLRVLKEAWDIRDHRRRQFRQHGAADITRWQVDKSYRRATRKS